MGVVMTVSLTPNRAAALASPGNVTGGTARDNESIPYSLHVDREHTRGLLVDCETYEGSDCAWEGRMGNEGPKRRGVVCVGGYRGFCRSSSRLRGSTRSGRMSDLVLYY